MNKETNVVIIDDSQLCIDCLLNSLAEYKNVNICGTANNANTGIKLIMKLHPDLLFLDVEMPDMTGLELLHNLHGQINWSMQVVFYTAYDKYLLEALRKSAFDYLLKPFEKQEIDKVMTRYFNFISGGLSKNFFSDSLTKLMPDNSVFLIATITGFQLLRIEQIGLIKYINNRKIWNIFLSDMREIPLRRNTSAKDILKQSSSFVQINRDQIININYLSMINGKDCILIPPFDKFSDLLASSGFLRLLQDRYTQI